MPPNPSPATRDQVLTETLAKLELVYPTLTALLNLLGPACGAAMSDRTNRLTRLVGSFITSLEDALSDEAWRLSRKWKNGHLPSAAEARNALRARAEMAPFSQEQVWRFGRRLWPAFSAAEMLQIEADLDMIGTAVSDAKAAIGAAFRRDSEPYNRAHRAEGAVSKFRCGNIRHEVLVALATEAA